jgi:hypothetical protein
MKKVLFVKKAKRTVNLRRVSILIDLNQLFWHIFNLNMRFTLRAYLHSSQSDTSNGVMHTRARARAHKHTPEDSSSHTGLFYLHIMKAHIYTLIYTRRFACKSAEVLDKRKVRT